ncbi:GNAT family N-acetyltransferase [Sphingomonas sp. HF-S3]|uniref:GNAT family N-acetyltransferase n=1 Tax=Sphingomonas rustica TaxID=3103142 RepID=A0ABV0B3P9_9SPHN
MIDYRPAVAADGPALSATASESFTETFGHLYRPEDLAQFLDQTFGPSGLPSQIGHPDFTIQVATDAGRVVGFAKVGPVAFPGDWSDSDIELYQIYVLSGWFGSGIGAALMDWAIETARARGFRRLVLSVFVDNHRARRFYARYGMREVGRYEFKVGTHVDEDVLMVLDL